FHQDLAVGVDHAHDAVGADAKGLVVRTVFLGLLRHQADVGHAAHGRRVERAVGLAVLDHRLVDAGVAAVGDHRLGVLQFAVRVPHATAVADHRRHRGVDDHVAGHVQVGDALVGIDHRHARAL